MWLDVILFCLSYISMREARVGDVREKDGERKNGTRVDVSSSHRLLRRDAMARKKNLKPFLTFGKAALTFCFPGATTCSS